MVRPHWAEDKALWKSIRARVIQEHPEIDVLSDECAFLLKATYLMEEGNIEKSYLRCFEGTLLEKAFPKKTSQPSGPKMPGKGKAQIGEERTWKGGKFKKVGEGDWKPAGGGRKPGKQKPEGKEKKPPTEDPEERKKQEAEAHAQAAVFVTRLAAKIGKGVAEKVQELYEGRILEGVARTVGEAGGEPGGGDKAVDAAAAAVGKEEKKTTEGEDPKKKAGIDVAPGQKPEKPQEAIKEEQAKKAKIAKQTKEGGKATAEVAKRAEKTQQRIAGRPKKMTRKAEKDTTRGTKQEQSGKVRRQKTAVEQSVLSNAQRETAYDRKQAVKDKKREAKGVPGYKGAGGVKEKKNRQKRESGDFKKPKGKVVKRPVLKVGKKAGGKRAGKR